MSRPLQAVCLAISVLLISAGAVAQSEGAPASQAATKERIARAREHWARMSPEEKKRLRQRYNRWKALPEQDRKRLRESYNRWNNMNSAQRQTLRKRWNSLQKMPRQERSSLQQRMDMIRRLPPERQRLLYEFLRQIKRMTPEERQRLRALPREERKRVLRSMLQEIARRQAVSPRPLQGRPASRPAATSRPHRGPQDRPIIGPRTRRGGKSLETSPFSR